MTGWPRMLRRGLALFPAFGILTGLFFMPIALLLAVSFWSVRSYRLVPGFALDAYARTFSFYGPLFISTMLIAAAVALLCVVVGFVFAYGARFRSGRYGDLFILATMITLFGGYLVKIYSWKAILSANGILNSTLLWLGLVDTPVSWFIFNRGAVIVALAHFLLPFAILPIYSALRNVPDITLEAARDLGASPWTTLVRVVLPQCKAGLVAAFAICFLSAAGDYVTPMFLGGGSGIMLGQFIVSEFSTRFNWPVGAAMSFSLMGVSALVISAIWLAVVGRRG
ncbi:MAG: ABC transporter permease [Mesorhizobium sp.]|uniref:ABC transporter permease n=1 Tax=Mesorhizobium sp. TaxID=1871066 RepID=UPI001ACDCB11|nr:ABC transporter permease [Mesorhizobium sp.]MBN9216374.1 ABC transporter permease [Mesorhizobium sp.]